MGMLSGLIANIGGPTQAKRKLIMAATNSILLYGNEIWCDAPEIENKWKILSAVQRTAALRVASFYRTVSGAAVLVIVGEIPIDRRRSWKMKRENIAVSSTDLRSQILRRWQNKWSEEINGSWTG